MSIHRRKDVPQSVHPWDKPGLPYTSGSNQCFHCDTPIRSARAIEWMGSGGSIYLHPDCAVDLMIRIMRDVHAIQCIENTQTLFYEDRSGRR